MKEITFAVLGGDKRQGIIANALAEERYTTKTFALPEQVVLSHNIKKCQNLTEAMEDTHVVVLPLPVSTTPPYLKSEIAILSLEEILAFQRPLYLGGKLNESFYSMAKKYNCRCMDYLEREELNILNAIPTAEGAIQFAMEQLPITLHGAPCLVIGFGRIGKLLANMLRGIGATVSCAARKRSDLAWIEAMGYRAIAMDQLKHACSQQTVLFNTAPALLLTRDILKTLSPDTLLIDLASHPGGIDWEAAKEYKLQAFPCLSLPGKVAPVTAGIAIKNTILNMIEELEV